MPIRRWTSLTLLALAGLGSVALAVNRPTVASPVKAYVEAAHIGSATTYRNLTVFPVTLHHKDTSGVTLLDEAIRSQQLVVHEIGAGRVNSLNVENLGKTPVFIMAGEILEGAKQNRVLQSDVLIPPHSGPLDIGAFCVEHGRWTNQEPNVSFKSGGLVTNPAVRAEAQASRSQGAVWDEVAKTNHAVAAPSTMGALNEAYAAPKVQEDMSGFVAAFQDLPQKYPDMVGAVAVIGHRTLASDCFGDRAVELGLWPKLIRSYALQAESDRDAAATVPTAQANDFLALIFDASSEIHDTPGTGQLLDISGVRCSGSALVYEGWPLHVALFPRNDTSGGVKPDSVPALERPYPR
jgi:hypothetical protein